VAMLTSRYLAEQARLDFSFCQSFSQIAILYQESYCFQTDKPIRGYVDARVVMEVDDRMFTEERSSSKIVGKL
jgi:hypothetical protein